MASQHSTPNIVILMPDEMRGDAMDSPILQMPNFGRLARDGVSFTQHFTVNPVCGPSRCCMFTGQYPQDGGHRSLYQMLRPHEENLFRLLKEGGYQVIWIGRNDLFVEEAVGPSVTARRQDMRKAFMEMMQRGQLSVEELSRRGANPFPKGHRLHKSFYFGKREPEGVLALDELIIEDALAYLDSRPQEPFCLFVCIGAPHPPYAVEEPYFSMYDRGSVPVPIPADLEDKPAFMRQMHKRLGLHRLTEQDLREIVATYYGMISKVDAQFGKLLAKLEQVGAYDDSVILITSDHGDYTGDYGLTEKWPTGFQDCLVRVPLVVKFPGCEWSGRTVSRLTESIDLFPTLLELAGVETAYTHFGKSLLPLARGDTSIHREAVFSVGGYDPREPQCFEPPAPSPDHPMMGLYYDKTNLQNEDPSTVARATMIRTTEWKLVIRSAGKEELYDLRSDPRELKNLIDDPAYASVQADLRSRLLYWYLRTSDNPHWEHERHP